MRGQAIKELDVIGLLVDLPEYQLRCGAMGTIVDDPGNGFYLVEFADRLRRTHALATFTQEMFLVLYRIEDAKMAA